MMVLKQIAELKNRPIDLSDIPEVTPSQAKEFYPRSLKERFKLFIIFLTKIIYFGLNKMVHQTEAQ